MPGTGDNRPRNHRERQFDLVRVATFYLRGFSQNAIAREMDRSPITIKKDLDEIRKQWREKYVASFEQKVSEELAKIDALEHEAYLAWERSKEKSIKKFRQVKQVELDMDGSGDVVLPADEVIEREMVEQPVGDPQFLNVVMRCVDRRCQLLGLDAPKKTIGAGVILNGEQAESGSIAQGIVLDDRARINGLLTALGITKSGINRSDIDEADVVDAGEQTTT